MRRREFVAGLGGAAAWPLAARAQPVERMRRIGVLTTRDETDPVTKLQVSALTQALGDLGLVGPQPDIILTGGACEANSTRGDPGLDICRSIPRKSNQSHGRRNARTTGFGSRRRRDRSVRRHQARACTSGIAWRYR